MPTRSRRRCAWQNVDPLEPRTMLDAVFWDGGAGTMDWNDPGNWNRNGADEVPEHNDDVVIVLGGPTPIVFDDNSVNLGSLITDTPLRVEGGTLGLNGSADVNAPIYAAGGDLWGGAWDVTDAAIYGQGSHLFHVQVTGDIILEAAGSVTIRGLSRFSRALLLSHNASIRFEAGYVLQDEIVADGPADGTRFVSGGYQGEGGLVIGPTGAIRRAATCFGDLSIGSVVNNGFIGSDSPTRALRFAGTLLNNAQIVATAGNLRLAADDWSNAGTISATDTLVQLSGEWSNADGTIDLANSNLELAGTFSTGGIGAITRVNSTIDLVGTLDNADAALVFNGQTGSWNLRSGTILGGAILFDAQNRLQYTPQGGTLTDVHLQGDLVLDGAQARTEIRGSTRFATARLQGGGSALLVGTGYVLRDSIVVEGIAGSGRWISTATIGAGSFTVAPEGSITVPAGSAAGLSITGNDSTIINEGTIAIHAPGQTLTLATRSVHNHATIAATAGRLLATPISSLFNFGQFTASNASLTLGGVWSNNGEISFIDSTLDLAGSTATDSIGALHRSGGVVNLTGNIDNTKQTLRLDAATGTWNLLGGRIQGGALEWTDDARLAFTPAGGVLHDVAIQDDVVLDTPGASVLVQGSTRFPVARLSAPDTTLGLVTGYTLHDPVIADGPAEGTRFVTGGYIGGGSVTISPTGSVRLAAASAGDLTINSSGAATLVNAGLVSIDAPGSTFTLAPATWINESRIVARDVTLNLGGTFATDAIGDIDRDGSVVNLTGTINNASSSLRFDAQRGSWNLAGGTVGGGSMVFEAGNRLHFTPAGGTLLNVLSESDLVLDEAGASVVVAGGTRFPALSLAADAATVRIASGGYLLRDQIISEGPGEEPRVILAPAGNSTFTISMSGSISLAAGSSADLRIQADPQGRVVNQGSIRSEASGRTLVINARSISNAGLISIAAGARVAVNAGFVQNPSGVLEIRISGPEASDIGSIAIAQSASVSGTLRILPVDGWTPDAVNATFLSAGTLSGQFLVIDLPEPPDLHQSFVRQDGAALRFIISSVSDFNRDGTVNSQDFFDFLAAFFAETADFNGDGVTNSQDLFDFLRVFLGE